MDDHVVEQIQRILEGRCPDCGKYPPNHSVLCDSEEFNRLMKLKNTVAKNSLLDAMHKVKDKKLT